MTTAPIIQPFAVIVGAQKGGTSTLFSTLAKHPLIEIPRDRSTGKVFKEINFFNDHFARGAAWYLGHFSAIDKVALDASPNYFCDPLAHQRLFELMPEARLIVSLRNPIDRAFSQFNHYRQMLPGTLHWDWRRPGKSFAENVRAEVKMPFPHWQGLIGRGMYAAQLRSLLQFFRRDQLHVIALEQWCVEPNAETCRLLKFLGLPEAELELQTCHVREYGSEQIDDFTRNQLWRLYQPQLNELVDLVGIDHLDRLWGF
ncbi:sulfotransferase family protein [Roseiconus lacunae]|uniref:Sulfotransferase n=1 Tax=Roseiconus lacunae TaxID=2605694 RepID=A0ABT7PGS4_9BACT|nr:sulfotransferase [Roseiconus lacunae]MDM4015446.1 sulfotransferase [Roseiconus lacunae]